MSGVRALVNGDVKRCTKCLVWKPIGDFRLKKARCKPCLNDDRQNWISRNPDAPIRYRKQSMIGECEKNRRRRENVIGRCKAMMSGANCRAKRSGLPINITWQILHVMMIEQNMRCKQTGILFDLTGKGKRGRNLTCPSIDKIDPDKGYVIGNVQIVCWFYNMVKGRDTDAVVWSLIKQAWTFKAGNL